MERIGKQSPKESPLIRAYAISNVEEKNGCARVYRRLISYFFRLCFSILFSIQCLRVLFLKKKIPVNSINRWRNTIDIAIIGPGSMPTTSTRFPGKAADTTKPKYVNPFGNRYF